MINSVHERSLRNILNDYQSPYSLLLEEAPQITLHKLFINSLMIEIYKQLNGHSPHIMNDIFKSRGNFLRNFYIFQTEKPHSLKYRLDAIPHVLAYSSNKCLLISVRQLLQLFSKIVLRLGNVKIVHVDLSKYLLKMSGLYDQGPLVTDGNISVN